MYQSDLKSDEWVLIENYFTQSDKHGCKPKHKKKVIVDAILYVVKSGYQWRMLPKDFPSWKTGYGHFNRWNKQGLLEHALDKLNGFYRERENRHAKPSHRIIDSQSVKTIYASEERGINGGKKSEGRESATSSWILWELYCAYRYTPPANTHDTMAGPVIFERVAEKYATVKTFSGDAGYRGGSVTFVESELQLKLHISTKIEDTFAILPKRWIDELIFAWQGNFRRLAKDVEILRNRRKHHQNRHVSAGA